MYLRRGLWAEGLLKLGQKYEFQLTRDCGGGFIILLFCIRFLIRDINIMQMAHTDEI